MRDDRPHVETTHQRQGATEDGRSVKRMVEDKHPVVEETLRRKGGAGVRRIEGRVFCIMSMNRKGSRGWGRVAGGGAGK